METLQAFADRVGLTFHAAPLAARQDAGEWGKAAYHWTCTIRRGSASMDVPYSMGAAHRRWDDMKLRGYCGTYTVAELTSVSPTLGASGIGGAPESIALQQARQVCTSPIPPELCDVLDCLASDAQGYENARGFEDWAAEYGYNTDSRKAEKVYHQVEAQARELRALLGLADYRLLLEEVERL